MPPVTTRPLTGRMGWVKERGNPPRRGLSVAARTMQTEETPKRKRSSRPPRFLRPFRIRQAGKPVPRQRNETICCRLCPFKKLGQARAGRDRQRQARQAGTGGTGRTGGDRQRQAGHRSGSEAVRPTRFLWPFRIRQAGKPMPRQRNETICCRLCPNKKLGQARAGRDRQKQAGQAKTGGTPKRKHSCRPTRFLRPFCIQQAGKPVPGITRNYRSVGFRHDLWPGLAAFALLHRHDIKPPTGRPLGAENRPYVVVPLPVQLP